MRKFTLGVVAGMSSLAIAVPLVAQVAGAASPASSSNHKSRTATPPTQACLQAMVGLESAHLANFDTQSAKQKQRLQDHLSALQTVAAMTDDTQRADALKKMHDTMQATHPTQDDMPAAIKTAMDAVKTACGNTMMEPFGRQRGMGMGMDNGMMPGGPKGAMGNKGLHKGWERQQGQGAKSSTSSSQ